MVIPKSSDNANLEWLELAFKATEGTQEIRRLIIRSLDNDIDPIKDGKVILFPQNSEGNVTLPFTFEHPDDCVVAINFSHSDFTTAEKTIIENTSKIRIDIDDTRGQVKAKRGFKADLFIKKKLSY